MRIRHFVCIGAVLVLTACGSGDGGDGAPASKQDAAPNSESALSEVEAKKALLTIDDFESDWKADPADDADADITITKGSPACTMLVKGPGDEAPTKVESSFTRDDGASMGDRVESYDNTPRAEHVWSADLRAISACHDFTLGGSDAPSIELKLEPTAISDLGDDAAAFRAYGTSQGVTMNLDVLRVRAGRNVVALTTVALNERAPRDRLEERVRTILDRLDALDSAD
ncbi:MAG: hypothetical protein QOH68_2921 [Nocardioidaceae bacterium]|jgi:hypothetical protein|nr:hypothetical protein [Nocardioidaceae bacterium]